MSKLKKPTIKNPELIRAVNEWKENKTPYNEDKMMEELQKAKFIAPAIMEDLPEDLDLSDGQKYEAKAKFLLVKDQRGVHFFPAFTEWLEVLKWNDNLDDNVAPVLVSFDNYAQLLLKRNPEARGIVVDPKGINLMVPTAVIAKAKGINLAPPTAPNGQPGGGQQKQVNMNVKPLEHYPDELIAKLKSEFEVTDSVRAAYILGMESAEEPVRKSYFLILDLANISDDARKMLFSQLGNIAKPYVSAPIGLMPIQSPIGQDVSKRYQPFYAIEGYEPPVVETPQQPQQENAEDAGKEAAQPAETSDEAAEEKRSEIKLDKNED